jgi:ABC-type phosphate transport system substrate-binding protein
MARNKSILGLGAVMTAALTVCTTGSAFADLAPTAGDTVGVGSDTVQNIGNFLADGDNAGDAGYNGTFPKNRLVSFDATPDQNDRAGYANGSTALAPIKLNPTIVLRQGLQPVQRPNGSGAGVAALIADSAHNIDFVRMSRLPKVSEQNSAIAATGVGALRVIKISTDNLKLATASTTNAPAAALTAAQIVDIYKCNITNWSAVGGSAGVIQPQIPQSGSGTGDSFRADLQALNGGTAVTVGACVAVGEENDPGVLAGNPNAIGPFSEGRKNLFDSGYFNSPNVVYGATPVPLASGIKFNSVATYNDVRGLFIVFRNSDSASTTKFQPGGALNKIQDLFYNPTNIGGVTPYVASDAGIADITAAGSTPAYVDCGSGAGVTSC